MSANARLARASPSAVTRRTYGQYCAVARGLDIMGDRWMLLIVRDLLLGPRRYTDLLDGQPGIGTNLLAVRLREMEAAGLLERAVLPPPAGSAVYQLTEAGRTLEPVIFAIGRWGARFLGQPRTDDVLVPRAYLVAIRAGFRPERAAGLAETYELRIGRLVFEVRVKDGQCTTREGAVVDPDAVFTMDVQTLNDLLLEGLSPRATLADGRIEIKGDPVCLDHFVEVFGLHTARSTIAGAAMKIPKPTAADRARFESLVPHGPRVEVKPMFGNLGAFVNGNMFMGLFGPDVGVKLDVTDQAELSKAGGGPFGPAERPMGGYLSLPATFSEADAKQWAATALNYVSALPPKTKKPPK